MAARRITQETLDAVLQEKANRYHMDPSGEGVGEALQFKAQDLLRTVPRTRADVCDDIHSDSRYSLSGSITHSRDTGREGLRGEVFPGPSFRSSNPSISEDNYFRKECGRDLEFSHPDSRDQVFGHRKLGHFRSQDWKFALRGSWEQDFGHPVSQESSWSQEYSFGPSTLLGGFASSRLIEKECLEKESRDYDIDHPGEADSLLRGSGRGLKIVDQEGALLGKGDTQGLLMPKVGAGKRVTLRSVSTKKVPTINRVTPKTQGTNQIQKTTPSPDVTLGTNPGTEDIQFPTQKIPLGLNLKDVRLSRRKMSFDPIDKSDVFSRFGIEIIKWAGFHTIKDDVKFSQLFQTLFELETETCAKMLASFKCSLKPEHRDFCFFTIKFLKHSALKTPRVDNEFLNMLLDKGAVKTKNCFFEIIKPFDKYIMRLQDRLLKSVTPLLMACNAYELSVKMKTLSNPLDLAVALETTNSLCRKSLALLGQTFSLASSFRQEKILEAVGLQDIAPSPAAFPNFEDSTLFGREYIDHLKAWLVSSGCPLQVKKAEPEPLHEEEKMVPSLKPKIQPKASSVLSDAVPQRADHKVVDTIDQLVSRVVGGSLSPKERALLKEDPAYWFLSDDSSLEYKYYKLKLAEVQRMSQTLPGVDQKPVVAECAVRAMLYARAVRSLKKRLLPGRRRGLRFQGFRGWKGRRATTGTQTLLSSGTRLRHHSRQASGSLPGKPPKPDRSGIAKNCLPDPAGPSPQDPSSESSAPSPKPVGVDTSEAPQTSSPCPSADVDKKTMETAEKLAKFVAQVGPEIEQFSIENSTDNPDLWFLHDQNSSAFKFYRKKVFELCPSICFTSSSLSLHTGEHTERQESALDPGEEEGESEDEHPHQETELESPELMPEEEEDEEEEGEGEEEEEEDEDEEGGEEAPAPGRASRLGGATKSDGSLPADGFPSEMTEDGPAGAPALSQTASGACFPRKRVSSKSLKVGMIPAPKRLCLIQEPKVHEPVRIAYDRPRGRPVSKKKKPKDFDFAQQKLTDKNLGFQMLQKMGWKEGHGLGSCGKGIREPVSVGTASEGEGLGADGQEHKEDTFDVFRQRMMQMYRHKRANK
ncbi:SURP and G-patch domain-containing protein 2 [Talpa occidentalis]|uniref:SURP and G-patch domain-containing protein 2 n=1 Tax=Talpa occidentalis TaxID=50954 RepID=UPI00188E2A12|nr:SURP and G-patch domain-containing protein 2 [Talpa occidentalis]XP_037362112.1 SURP and G-patch domain-containing protein 2 [Talpa occidentalis]XP_037362113.1 SURP and G-patch domain-containing protein 2 [Talpa occidentalis]XP_037362114.1 SURP and G-patch domain-containing protein 2 [Talpa occidentalis]XP_037362115.1 SURP and G-patch domain-containing protein 2 [Talpa occidentalis]XP_054549364.1 SURP and G-patch domain-containing protein 2 [Talpa occidentalis]XP_054549365.1 SURP and G-pat